MIIYSGRRCALPGALTKTVREMMNADSLGSILVMVPDQLTLETEMLLIKELNLPGSFTLTVLSPKKLCSRVFEEAGKPSAATIDEMGRAMIMGHLLRKNASKLRFFRTAASKPGFEERIISEIRCFKQAGVTPDELDALAESSAEPGKSARLSDIALLYRAYEEKLAGHVQDGEDELQEACRRFAGSDFVCSSRVLVYGFDITTASVNRVICALVKNAVDVRVFLPLSDEGRGVYMPMYESAIRLDKELERHGLTAKREFIEDSEPDGSDIDALGRGLFSLRAVKKDTSDGGACLVKLKDELEEARFAAATIRKLTREKGWRYSDIRVVTYDPTLSNDTLCSAFEEYNVPFFSQESRSAINNPLCVFLCETLRLISGRGCSVPALLGSGFADVTRDEAEALIYYMNALDLKPSALMKPFRRGGQKKGLLDRAEPVRIKLMEPVLRLKKGLSDKSSLKAQLTAVYEYLTDTRCCEKAAMMRSRLQELGMAEQAATDAQVWNKLMSVMDQLLELLGPEGLAYTEISDLIERALRGVSVKQLPLSPDCVEISTPDRMGMTRVRAVILIGAVQESGGASGGIFPALELKQIQTSLRRYLRPDTAALTKTRRMYVKDLFTLAEEYIMVCWHSGSGTGEAVKCSAIVNEITRILPGVRRIGDNLGDPEIEHRLLSAPKGALNYMSSRLSSSGLTDAQKEALAALRGEPALDIAMNARAFSWSSRGISTELAAKLYDKSVSVSRLEKYAQCPFFAFVEYGIKPDKNEKYNLDPKERGTLLHSCVEELGKVLKDETLTEDEAEQRIDKLADELIGSERFSDILGDTAVAGAEAECLRKTARRAARTFARQAKTREFRPIELEMDFNGNDFSIQLSTGETISFNGKVDRVDSGVYNGRKYVSIIDYKSGKKELSQNEIYLGTQLQLLIYLSVAMKKYSAGSAGVYYFSLRDEVIKDDTRDADKAAELRAKQEMLRGIGPSDTGLLSFMAEQPSGIYDIGFKKGGDAFKDSAKVASEEDFRRLITYSRDKARELTEAMFSGNTDIRPAAKSDEGACRYCDYSGVCFRSCQPREKAEAEMSFKNLGELLTHLTIKEVEGGNAQD